MFWQLVCGAEGSIFAQLSSRLALGGVEGVLAQAATVKATQKAIGSLFMNLTSSFKGYAPPLTNASLLGLTSEHFLVGGIALSKAQ